MVETRGRPRRPEVGSSSKGKSVRRERTPPVSNDDLPPPTPQTTDPPVQPTTETPQPQTENPPPARTGAEGSSGDMFQMFTAMLAAMEQQRGRQVIEIREPVVQTVSTSSTLEKFMKLNPPVFSGEPIQNLSRLLHFLFKSIGIGAEHF